MSTAVAPEMQMIEGTLTAQRLRVYADMGLQVKFALAPDEVRKLAGLLDRSQSVSAADARFAEAEALLKRARANLVTAIGWWIGVVVVITGAFALLLTGGVI